MGSNGWSTGLFAADALAEAVCSPCTVMGKTAYRMQDPTMEGYTPCNNDCFMGFCLGNFWTCAKRGEIRDAYGIEGSGPKDFCITCFCMCCAVAQNEREVKARQKAGNRPVTMGYQNQQTMQMPAPGTNPAGYGQGYGQPYGQGYGQNPQNTV